MKLISNPIETLLLFTPRIGPTADFVLVQCLTSLQHTFEVAHISSRTDP